MIITYRYFTKLHNIHAFKKNSLTLHTQNLKSDFNNCFQCRIWCTLDAHFINPNQFHSKQTTDVPVLIETRDIYFVIHVSVDTKWTDSVNLFFFKLTKINSLSFFNYFCSRHAIFFFLYFDYCIGIGNWIKSNPTCVTSRMAKKGNYVFHINTPTANIVRQFSLIIDLI